MQQSQPQQPLIDGPLCKCGVKMWLARVAPYEGERELHIFECPDCKQSESVIATFK